MEKGLNSHNNSLILPYIELDLYFMITCVLNMNPIHKRYPLIIFGFRRKISKQIFKMAAMAAIWDFLSQRFELFFIYKSPRCFLPSFDSIDLSVQKKKGKIDFQDSRHLGFPIGTILVIFISTRHPDAAYQFSNQLALWFKKKSKKKKRVSRWPP